MKSYILICALLVNAPVWSAEEKKENTGVSGGVIVNDSIQKLLDVEGVKPIFEACERNHTGTNKTNAQRTEKIYTCLWDEIKEPKNAQLKKKVLEAYNNEAKANKNQSNAQTPNNGRSPASTAPVKSDNSSGLLAKRDNVSVDYNLDPSVKALSDFYAKKLDEILNPEKALSKDDAKNGVILSVDHKKFIELYKTELGKTIINAFTSYCLEADPGSTPAYLISSTPSTREDTKKDNLKKLKNADFNKGSADDQIWLGCIKDVSTHCKPNPNGDDEKESSKRACLIVDYVQAARKNLMIADSQIKEYDELEKSKTINIASNVKGIEDHKKLNNDKLLELTSSDIEDSLKKPLDQEKIAFEQCFKNNAVVNADACKKYLSTDVDNSANALVELGLRQEAKQAHLEEELKSKDKVVEYLKAEGYNDEQIKEMTLDDTKTKTTKDEIIERYAAQKKAIIAEMAAKIEKKTSSDQGKIDATNDVSKLQIIRDEMNARSEDLKNLVKFNNIVSSYLTVGDKNSKTNSAPQRNTASLFAEVDSMKDDDAKKIKENMQKANLTDSRDAKSSGSDLGVDTINDELIKYSTQPKKKVP